MDVVIRLLLGGSPCTYWSIAQSSENRETEPSGMGWELFLNYRIARDKYKPDYFIYENNKSMAPAIKNQITRELGVDPVLINSSLVSAQSRERLYWIGRRNPDGTYSTVRIVLPPDRGILLRDILDSGVAFRDKGYTLKANYGNGSYMNGVSGSHFPAPMAAEPIRIGTIEAEVRNEDFDSKQYRLYSPDGKAVTLCGQGGGLGARTGLYAAPFPSGAALRAREENTCYEVRIDQKANTVLAEGHQSRLVVDTAEGKARQVYEVKDGFVTMRGQKYPINLPDGYYIIRKLTVRECMRLQTVPESYLFPVSSDQAYRLLGNGWTVDVVAHILSHIPWITTEPIEVLSMYDGMSCGHIALDKLGANVVKYYAS